MLYIQQSLNPDEEIIRVGEFHWWYTFSAAFWIFFGVLCLFGAIFGGFYWEIMQFVKENYNNIPSNLKSMAWDESIQRMGGYWGVFKSIHVGVKLAGISVFAMCILIFVQKMVIKATTEICLTSDRLVLKRGVVARHVEEISVDRIEGVDVFQGFLGRVLGFGRVSARGMGVGEISLPLIAQPVDFKKAIDRARSIRRNNNF